MLAVILTYEMLIVHSPYIPRKHAVVKKLLTHHIYNPKY